MGKKTKKRRQNNNYAQQKQSEDQQNSQPDEPTDAKEDNTTQSPESPTDKPALTGRKAARLTWKKALLVAIPGAIVALLVAINIQDRYKLVMQTDYSVNFTVALMDTSDKQPRKGQYIAFTYKAIKNDPRYGRRFVKRVACLPGEDITLKTRDFYCGSDFIGTAKTHDRTGKPAPLFEYNGKVPEGAFFASGDTKDSYDSKYWGFASDEWIIGKVIKLI